MDANSIIQLIVNIVSAVVTIGVIIFRLTNNKPSEETKQEFQSLKDKIEEIMKKLK